jgi:hypothetical protein
LPTPTGPDQDGLPGVQPAQGREVADLNGWQFRGGGEVEAFEGGGGLEAGAAQAAVHTLGLAAGDLVIAQDLEELEVSEVAVVGLGQAGVEGFEHAGEF